VSGNVVHVNGLERGYVRKEPKSEHGLRLIALDPQTVRALRAHQERRRSRLGEWNDTLAEDAYLFSVDEAGRHPVRRDTMGKRSATWPPASGTAIPCTGYATSR
jgi:hypothetical protein